MRNRTNGKTASRCAIYTRKSSEEGLEQDFNSLEDDVASVGFVEAIGIGRNAEDEIAGFHGIMLDQAPAV